MIHDLAARLQGDIQIIEGGIGGGPELGRSNGEDHGLTNDGRALGHGLSAEAEVDGDLCTLLAIGDLGEDAELALVHIGCDAQAGDILMFHGFHPHGLPDTRNGIVPGGGAVQAGCQTLLAHGLIAGIGLVHDLHDKGVGALDEFVGDIDGEGTEAAGMGSSLLTIDVNGGVVVHGTEVQDDVLTLPVGGNGELTRIP